MREIKFRAWDEEEKEMLECVSVACTRVNKWITMRIKNGYVDSVQNPYVLMQYTGLKDKNGKEIYEGDIVEFVDLAYVDLPKRKGYVTFKNASFCIVTEYASHYRWIDYSVEMVGNTHENPELL